jgi:hypothetical protein
MLVSRKYGLAGRADGPAAASCGVCLEPVGGPAPVGSNDDAWAWIDDDPIADTPTTCTAFCRRATASTPAGDPAAPDLATFRWKRTVNRRRVIPHSRRGTSPVLNLSIRVVAFLGLSAVSAAIVALPYLTIH